MRIERHMLFWLAALVVLVFAVGVLRSVLLPFVIGIVLAYFLNPIADWLEAKGVNRVAASAIVGVVLAAVAIAVLVFLVPRLVSQIQQLAVALPGEWERLRGVIEAWARERLGARFPEFEAGLAKASQSLSNNWSELAGWAASAAWNNSLALFSLMSLLLVTPLVMFYVLVDWHRMLAKIDGWLPRDHVATVRRLADDVDGAVSAFIRGQGTVCLLLCVYYAVTLSAIGLNYGLLVGLATGLLSFIPFVGWALGLITACVLAILQFWPDTVPVMMVAGIFLLAQAMDAAVLSPKIVGSKIGLHPVWLIFALFVFSYLFGFLGMLVAVPVAAAIAVLVRHALSVYLESSLYRGETSATPVMTDLARAKAK